MAVTVCTLVRNRNLLLSGLVEGLSRSEEPPAQLVVVHAGGEDPAPVLRDAPFPVEVVRVGDGDERIPYAPARNAAARAASSPHLVFLDADTIPAPSMVGAFDAALTAADALCIGDVQYLPPGAADGRWTTESLDAAGRRHPARPVPPDTGWQVSQDYPMVWGLCVALRRDTLLERLGGFDEQFRGYAGEDTDLAERARLLGVPLHVVAGGRVWHCHHDSWEPPVQQLRATVENCRVFHRRHGWWPMQGWLEGFRDLGLVRWTPDADDLVVLRDPTPAEVDAVRCTVARPFR